MRGASYRRSFERAAGPRRFGYQRLLQVVLENDYYNASQDACPDFSYVPTPATVALMASLGLLLRDEGVGFSVLYDESRADLLLDYLRRQGDAGAPGSPSAPQVWTRLSFALPLTNPQFVNFTQLPLGTLPAKAALYFTNQQAHRLDGAVLLNTGEWVERTAFVPVVPAQVTVRADADLREVRVLDIAGRTVLCVPRCFSADASGRAVGCDGGFEASPPSAIVCLDTLYVDFALLPEGRYVIQKVYQDGTEDADALYTQAYPTPLCFIDLLFTRPTPDAAGIYPVRNPFSERAAIETVRYQLRFRRRATYWDYYVVPQPQSEPYAELRIVGKIGASAPFGPYRVVKTATGERAYKFSSNEVIPLQEQSEAYFRLLGRHPVMPDESVLVRRLPVASPRGLSAPKGLPSEGVSSIYVYV